MEDKNQKIYAQGLLDVAELLKKADEQNWDEQVYAQGLLHAVIGSLTDSSDTKEDLLFSVASVLSNLKYAYIEFVMKSKEESTREGEET